MRDPRCGRIWQPGSRLCSEAVRRRTDSVRVARSAALSDSPGPQAGEPEREAGKHARTEQRRWRKRSTTGPQFCEERGTVGTARHKARRMAVDITTPVHEAHYIIVIESLPAEEGRTGGFRVADTAGAALRKISRTGERRRHCQRHIHNQDRQSSPPHANPPAACMHAGRSARTGDPPGLQYPWRAVLYRKAGQRSIQKGASYRSKPSGW